MNTTQHYDVVILGTGSAGLQAAIHASRKKVSVLVLGKDTKSSMYHSHIENFCCIFNVKGDEIIDTGRKQAAGFGAQFADEDVPSIRPMGQSFELETESGNTIKARALILATGTQRNRLGVKGEREFLGKGVSYCVDCDSNFYKGEDVAVVGNESAAVVGALTLTEIANKVHLVSDRLDVSPSLREKLTASAV